MRDALAVIWEDRQVRRGAETAYCVMKYDMMKAVSVRQKGSFPGNLLPRS